MSYKIAQTASSKDKMDFIVEYNHNKGLRIVDTTDFKYALEANEIMDPVTNEPIIDPEYEEKQAKAERERLDKMSMTPSDVERALYKAKKMDFTDVKELIAKVMPEVDTKALAIEFRASGFYRGATFGANNTRLFDAIGKLLGYEPEDIDFLFITGDFPSKEELMSEGTASEPIAAMEEVEEVATEEPAEETEEAAE